MPGSLDVIPFLLLDVAIFVVVQLNPKKSLSTTQKLRLAQIENTQRFKAAITEQNHSSIQGSIGKVYQEKYEGTNNKRQKVWFLLRPTRIIITAS